jgi:hypothetical protein
MGALLIRPKPRYAVEAIETSSDGSRTFAEESGRFSKALQHFIIHQSVGRWTAALPEQPPIGTQSQNDALRFDVEHAETMLLQVVDGTVGRFGQSALV